MDFSLTKEQKFFKGQVSRALERIVAPFADSIDKTDVFPGELFRELGALGYYGIRYPVGYRRHGGRLHIIHHTGRGACAGLDRVCRHRNHAMPDGDRFHIQVRQCPTEKEISDSRNKGQKIGTIAFTEPDCGSDLGGIKTRAVKNDRGYILTGRKLWITDGDVADFVTVAATTDPGKTAWRDRFFPRRKRHARIFDRTEDREDICPGCGHDGAHL